jgi:inosine-uridine nucleoside N-ribohydrolase
MRVEIELRGELAYGRTCCDFFGLENSPDSPASAMFGEKAALDRPKGANARVGVDVNAARFWDIVYETFAMYGK